MDEVKSSTALAILEKLGPCGQRDSLNSRAKYLIQSLGRPLTREDQLVRLALLRDVLWSESLLRSVVNTCKNKKHMSEILATTMWGLDGKPDLDHRRVELRLSWFLADPSGMYSQIRDRDFGRYLSLWCESAGQLHPLTSSKSDYPETVIRLLLQDQKRWAKELDEYGHLKHIEATMPEDLTRSDPQLLAFILIAHIAGRNGDPNAPSHYYSQARVDRVVEQLRLIHPHGARFDFGSLQPHHADSINQSLHGYIKTAYQYQRIQDNVFNEVSQLAKALMDHIRSEALLGV
ncbi:hypothetical protein FRC02_000448 [Tulasnella sp. 418]|nr:hypothetical protein FRC02_000448 [Tulasnella sp. 418]